MLEWPVPATGWVATLLATKPTGGRGNIGRMSREQAMEETTRGNPMIGRVSVHPLVALARSAVEAYIAEQRVIEPSDPVYGDPAERAGVFVCIKIDGDLRGCIGTLEPTLPTLAGETVQNAISAATGDPRFEPVTAGELSRLEYMVDVLTAPERVRSEAELDPRRYGVIVRRGGRRGLLLPDLEGVDTVADQIRIARSKAGIGAHDAVEPVPLRGAALQIDEEP